MHLPVKPLGASDDLMDCKPDSKASFHCDEGGSPWLCDRHWNRLDVCFPGGSEPVKP